MVFSLTRPVSGLLIASMAASLLECGWAIFGTYWAFSSNHCVFSAPEFVLFLRIVVLVNWIHFVIVALAYAALFISSTSSKLDHNDAEVVSLVWRDRLASLCCCIKMDDSDAQVFVEIGKVAADLFVGVDVTPSDVAASLVVLNHEDEQAQRSAEHPKGPMVKLKELKEVHYWLRYATAVYGMPSSPHVLANGYKPNRVDALRVCTRTYFRLRRISMRRGLYTALLRTG